MSQTPHLRHETQPGRESTSQRCLEFLTQRLVEELAQLWERDASVGSDSRPGLAAQVAVLDDLLTTLDRGDLPVSSELRILLHAYGAHPEYDPMWTVLANG